MLLYGHDQLDELEDDGGCTALDDIVNPITSNFTTLLDISSLDDYTSDDPGMTADDRCVYGLIYNEETVCGRLYLKL